MYKIVIDTLGSDKGVEMIAASAVEALNERDDVTLVLVGNEYDIRKELEQYDFDHDRIIIEHAPDLISNEESPTTAIKVKKQSSMVRAFEITKADPDVIGMISAGSTGAVLTGGILKIGRIKGVLRPALCPLMPTYTGGRVCICDSGANMDCKPEYLVQFAVMGSKYMKSLGIENPRVALVSVGTEDKKGNELTHEVFARLKEMPEINFVGNMEARDALSGDYDVLVCDGFVGNVLLKTVEGTATTVMRIIRDEIMGSAWAKIGYAMFMQKAFKNVKSVFNYHAFGGAAFLGVDKILVKAHGSSKIESIVACVNQVVSMHELGLVENIKSAVTPKPAAENTENA